MSRKAAPPSPVSRGTSALIAVRLPAEARAGVLRVGAYAPGVEYHVPLTEALRLVAAKGFEVADAASAEALRTFAAEFNAATPPGAASPSQADGQGGGTPHENQE